MPLLKIFVMLGLPIITKKEMVNTLTGNSRGVFVDHLQSFLCLQFTRFSFFSRDLHIILFVGAPFLDTKLKHPTIDIDMGYFKIDQHVSMTMGCNQFGRTPNNSVKHT